MTRLVSHLSKSIFQFLEFTFLLDEKSNKKVKAICQPEFFSILPKPITRLTKNSGSHQIAIFSRTVQDVN